MSTPADEECVLDLKGSTITLLQKEKLRKGRSGLNITVYKGYFNGTTQIAIKKYHTADNKIKIQWEKDLNILSAPDKRHENIIRYFGKAEMGEFCYLATELCECSVADIYDKKRIKETKEKNPQIFHAISSSLSRKEILLQSTEGVNFIHSKDIIHRNLHPDNFLISCVDQSNGTFIIKLTDFQNSRDISEDKEYTKNENSSGECWVAPESISFTQEQINKSLWKLVDSFIIGLFYYYVLSEGDHPFGVGSEHQMKNITDKNFQVYKDEWEDGKKIWKDKKNAPEKEEAGQLVTLIQDLLKFEAKERKSTIEILASDYFLSMKNKSDDENYHIYQDSSKKPGLCVIITQVEYHDENEDLGKGAVDDAELLETTFTDFGYDVLKFQNLRAQQIEIVLSPEYLADQQEEKSLNHFCSLVVCIAAHGAKGVVQGVDGETVSLNALQLALNNGSCPDLRGKPKIFIVNACQGSNQQAIVHQRNHPQIPLVIGNQENHQGMSLMVSPTVDVDSSPFKDFIRLSATIEEFVAWGDWNGSEFIKVLCNTLLSEYANSHHPAESKKRSLDQVFTAVVIPKVCKWSFKMKVKVEDKTEIHTMKQTPEYRTSLTKKIRFKRATTQGKAALIYDGKVDDNSFEPGRTLWPQKKLYLRELRGKNWEEDREYQILLKTVYAVAGKELPVVQRAVAWVIINRAEKYKKEKNEPITIESVCKEFDCWKNPIKVTDLDKWSAIDKWLPNVKKELGSDRKGRNGWDPSRGSLSFLEGQEKLYYPYGTLIRCEIEIGNFKFYKNP